MFYRETDAQVAFEFFFIELLIMFVVASDSLAIHGAAVPPW